MATTTQEIPKDAWRPYFDELSKILPTVEATVEITGYDLGDQIMAERLILTGISYDHKDDVVVIGLDAPGGTPEDVEHLVYNPQRIMVATSDGPETTIDIQDAEGRQTLIRYEQVPALPGA
jgi:hypothetical protein